MKGKGKVGFGSIEVGIWLGIWVVSSEQYLYITLIS